MTRVVIAAALLFAGVSISSAATLAHAAMPTAAGVAGPISQLQAPAAGLPPMRASASMGFALYGAGWYEIGSSSGPIEIVPTVAAYNGGRNPRTVKLELTYFYSYSFQLDQFAVSSQYVFGADEYFGNVYAFPIGSTRSAYTIGGLFPQAMVTDGSGNLYVALGTQGVAVYAPGSSNPAYTITDGLTNATRLFVDRFGYLYVGDTNAVVVYAPGSATPSSTISAGISGVVGLAVGGKERLYVANAETDSITAYSFGTTVPVETITQGLNGVGSVAVGPTGTLYAEAGSNTVTEYDKGGTTVSRSIAVSYCGGCNIAVDPLDSLYVIGTRERGPVYVYHSQKTKPAHGLGVENGHQIAIGPAW